MFHSIHSVNCICSRVVSRHLQFGWKSHTICYDINKCEMFIGSLTLLEVSHQEYSSGKYLSVPGNTCRFREIPVSSGKYLSVPGNTCQFLEIPVGSRKYLSRSWSHGRHNYDPWHWVICRKIFTNCARKYTWCSRARLTILDTGRGGGGGGHSWMVWVRMFVHKNEEKRCFLGPRRGVQGPSLRPGYYLEVYFSPALSIKGGPKYSKSEILFLTHWACAKRSSVCSKRGIFSYWSSSKTQIPPKGANFITLEQTEVPTNQIDAMMSYIYNIMTLCCH